MRLVAVARTSPASAPPAVDRRRALPPTALASARRLREQDAVPALRIGRQPSRAASRVYGASRSRTE